jgi:catechol 2,3-dioxygenase-like lactoylglutathione lyase family enzyme
LEVSVRNLEGFAHVELTVRDAAASAAWYEQVLGFFPRGDHRPDNYTHVIVMGHQSGMVVGFWQRSDHPAIDAFDEFRTGLDHIAFGARTRDEIDEWAAHFTALGVGHSEPVDAGPHGVVLTFRDPDNIQLEIYWRPD